MLGPPCRPVAPPTHARGAWVYSRCETGPCSLSPPDPERLLNSRLEPSRGAHRYSQKKKRSPYGRSTTSKIRADTAFYISTHSSFHRPLSKSLTQANRRSGPDLSRWGDAKSPRREWRFSAFGGQKLPRTSQKWRIRAPKKRTVRNGRIPRRCTQ